MSDYKKFTVEDFIQDASFIKWVNDPLSKEAIFWQKYEKEHPEQQQQIKEAADFVRSILTVEPEISQDRIENIWKKINDKRSPRRISIRYIRLLAAAAILIAVTTYSLKFFLKDDKVVFDAPSATSTVQLILPDGNIKSIEGDALKISQEKDGTLVADTDTIKASAGKMVAEVLNKLVVPYGKRTDLYLSDGSHIFINSGSQIAFPSTFKGNTREIYLSGEAFCEVAADKKHPFIVHTTDTDVKVTGTLFNVHAYDDEPVNQTVLVEGRVTLITKNGLLKDKLELNPGELAVFDKSTNKSVITKVETEQFTSWIHGYLILNKRSVDFIFKSLERYYNQKIIYNNISDITFSGKLDLNEDIGEVLATLAFASDLKIEEGSNQFIIKR